MQNVIGEGARGVSHVTWLQHYPLFAIHSEPPLGGDPEEWAGQWLQATKYTFIFCNNLPLQIQCTALPMLLTNIPIQINKQREGVLFCQYIKNSVA